MSGRETSSKKPVYHCPSKFDGVRRSRVWKYGMERAANEIGERLQNIRHDEDSMNGNCAYQQDGDCIDHNEDLH
jgi:hypothetical protein